MQSPINSRASSALVALGLIACCAACKPSDEGQVISVYRWQIDDTGRGQLAVLSQTWQGSRYAVVDDVTLAALRVGELGFLGDLSCYNADVRQHLDDRMLMLSPSDLREWAVGSTSYPAAKASGKAGTYLAMSLTSIEPLERVGAPGAGPYTFFDLSTITETARGRLLFYDGLLEAVTAEVLGLSKDGGLPDAPSPGSDAGPADAGSDL
jgi:hypothetical protein